MKTYYLKFQNRKMFPYTHLQNSILPFQAFEAQMYPEIASNNPYFSLGNCYYFFQTPYFQPQVDIDQFSSPTLVSKRQSEGFRPFQRQQDRNKNEKQMDNIIYSPAISSRSAFLRPQGVKTKLIQKKEMQIPMLRRDKQQKQKKMKAQIQYKQYQNSPQYQTNKKRTEEQQHLYQKYRRKNTQSNVINRIYSFLITQFKNKKQVYRLEISVQKKQAYLKYLLSVVQAWKGPVKRQLLFSLMNITDTLPAYKILQKTYNSQKVLSIEQFAYLNRVLIKMYLTNIASVSVITSKKMKKVVWREHLQKIRQLKIYFFQNEVYQE